MMASKCAVLSAVSVFLFLSSPLGAQEDSTGKIEKKKREVYRAFSGEDKEWSRLGDAEPGDWLAVFSELGQNFEEFTAQQPRRKGPTRSKIYLAPLGDFSDKHQHLLPVLRQYGEVFFHSPVDVLPPMPFPDGSYVKARKQHDTSPILRALRKARPADSLILVAFTDRDLFSGSLNFVFGVGDPQSAVGVYSIARYGDPKSKTCLRRTLKVMNHEMGHILSIAHCIFYKCSMNGSNSLSEADSRPIHYCPLDVQKLAWCVGNNVPDWYGKLREFYQQQGLKEEADFLSRTLDRLNRGKR